MGPGERDTARREPLLAALHDAETLLADAEPDVDRSTLEAAVTALQRGLTEHIDDTEGAGGLLQEIVHETPWLEPRARELQRDHERLYADAEALATRVRTDEAPAASLVDDVRGLARRLDRHRHQNTALLLDAYALDVPEGD